MIAGLTRRQAVAGLAAAAWLGMNGCAGAVPGGRPAPAISAPPTPKTGVGTLANPIALPPLALERSDGRPFVTADLRGRHALVFFGYTRCPDVCPLTLAHAAQVKKGLGQLGGALDIYFVTVDPARDTPARLNEYTANFKVGIVGLTGTPDTIARAADAFGVVYQRRPVPDRPDDYFMDHTALIFLVDPEARIRTVYPYATDPDAIAADLRGILPAVSASTPAPPLFTSAVATFTPVATTAPTVRVVDGWVRAATRGGGSATSAAYMRLENPSRTDDRLIAVRSDLAGRVELHQTSMDGGMMRMRPVEDVAVAAESSVELRPGGLHVMMLDLNQDLVPGSTARLTLRFAIAGDVVVDLPVRAATG